MPVRVFKIPDPLSKRVNKNILITGAALQVAKGALANVFIPDALTEDAIGRSYLGTPVIDNLEFPQGAYTDLDGNTIDYGAVVIDTVTFEVNRTKRTIETEIQGRDNSIFEYVGNSNFEITCTGIISNRDNIFPLETSRSLQKVFDVPQQIPIVSLFLNDLFEIFDVVIKQHRIAQTPGMRNEIPFSFVASQDVGLEVNELEDS